MKKIIILLMILMIPNDLVYAKELVKYSNCVDGDTIKVILNNEKVVVRLLAVDTPESVKEEHEVEYYGKEASEYTCNKIKNAKRIELEYDPKSEKYDKYDRLLAWVFVDKELLQASLVEGGYAKVAYLYDDYKYKDILLEKQELASAKMIGIWNQIAKEEYDNGSDSATNEEKINEYENLEVVVLIVLFLVMVLIGGKK